MRNVNARPFRLSCATAAWLVLIVGATGLVACSTQPKSTSAWQPNAPRDQSYSAILVVGVSPNLDTRCAFERVLARRLRSEHTLAACELRRHEAERATDPRRH